MAVKRFEYILILIGLFSFYLFYVSYLSFYLFLFFLVLPLFSLLLTVISGVRLQVSAESGGMSKDIVKKNEPFSIRLKFKSNSRLGSTRVRVKMAVKNEFLQTERRETLLFVMGKKEQPVSYTMTSEYCGRITCEILQVKVYDYLWLFSFSSGYRQKRKTEILVMPEIQMLDAEAAESRREDWESSDYCKDRPGDDPAEIYDIREYREGDRISRIHWKLSSKRNELLIKEGGLPVGSRILLALDLPAGDGEEMLKEGAAESLISLSWFLTENEISHKVGWCRDAEAEGGSFATINVEKEEDFYQMIHEIMSVSAAGKSSLVINGCLEESNISRVLYFCTGISKEEAEILCSSKNPSDICIFQIAEEGSEKMEILNTQRKIAENLGAEWIVLYPGRQTEILQGFEI